VRIEAGAVCRTAAAAAGKNFNGVVTEPYNPRGCYYFTDSNIAIFNTHTVGAGCAPPRVSSLLLCAAVATTTGAPQFAPFPTSMLSAAACCEFRLGVPSPSGDGTARPRDAGSVYYCCRVLPVSRGCCEGTPTVPRTG
jgi:hypothetical protein